jgi:hypothetical protein
MSNVDAVATLIAVCVAYGWLDSIGKRRRARRATAKAALVARKGVERKTRIAEQPARTEQASQPHDLTELRQSVAAGDKVLSAAYAAIEQLERKLAQQEAISKTLSEHVPELQAQLQAAQDAAYHWQQAYRRKMEEPATHAAPRSEHSDQEGQYRRLRALIVKELHPDHAPADSVDRAIRAEVFKAIWPKIEAIRGHT